MNDKDIKEIFENTEIHVYDMVSSTQIHKEIQKQKKSCKDKFNKSDYETLDELEDIYSEEKSLLINAAYRKGMRDMLKIHMNIMSEV